MPQLDTPLEPFVHIATALVTVAYVRVAFGRSPEKVRRSVWLTAAFAVLYVLGASWAAQVGAAITVAAFCSAVFGRWERVGHRLVVCAAAFVLFSTMHAWWALYPFTALLAVRLLGSPSCGSPRRRDRSCDEAGRADRRCRTKWQPPSAAHPSPVDLGTPDPVTQGRTDGSTTVAQFLANQRVPPNAQATLGQLGHLADTTLDYLRSIGRGSSAPALRVERVRDDYAPGAVRAYLAMPPWTADSTEVRDGMTAGQLLVQQLDLLVSEIHDVRSTLSADGGGELLAHDRFLKDRFTAPSEHLTL